MTTGKLIQELRIKSGHTQKTLAEALHITGKAISKWERDICLPDMALLPKLALLLDTDVEILLHQGMEQEEWVGEIDISGCDFSQIVYDKPLINYLLIHYLLVDITDIYVVTDEHNKEFLSRPLYSTLGFNFRFSPAEDHNVMRIEHPWFLFGSDLTQQFQASMLSQKKIKLVPENQEPVFFFSPKNNESKYCKYKYATRTLGRGMVCLDMGDQEKILDVATFVKAYERNSGLLIGGIEEVAYRKGYITQEQLMEMSRDVPYGNVLRKIAVCKSQYFSAEGLHRCVTQ